MQSSSTSRIPVYLVIASQLLCPLHQLPNIRRLHDGLVDHLTREEEALRSTVGELRSHISVLQSILRWRDLHHSEHAYNLADAE